MDSQLQFAALVAAISKPSLRESLNVEDFDGSARQVAESLKDGKSKPARESMKHWLATFGVHWDGKSDIGETILETLKETNRLERARRQLRGLQHVLQFPHLAGQKAVDEAMATLKAIEEAHHSKPEPSNPVRPLNEGL